MVLTRGGFSWAWRGVAWCLAPLAPGLAPRSLVRAAGVWMTAAIGVAIGLGRLGVAAIGVVFAWFVLGVVVKFERHPRSD